MGNSAQTKMAVLSSWSWRYNGEAETSQCDLTCNQIISTFSITIAISTITKNSSWGLSWWSSGYDSALPWRGTQVWSLIGELRSHMLHGVAKIYTKIKLYWINFLFLKKKKTTEKWWRTQVDWSFGLLKVSTLGLRGLLMKWPVQHW